MRRSRGLKQTRAKAGYLLSLEEALLSEAELAVLLSPDDFDSLFAGEPFGFDPPLFA